MNATRVTKSVILPGMTVSTQGYFSGYRYVRKGRVIVAFNYSMFNELGIGYYRQRLSYILKFGG